MRAGSALLSVFAKHPVLVHRALTSTQAAALETADIAALTAAVNDPEVVANFTRSGGEPRNVASPDINTEDFSAAVDFLGLPDQLGDGAGLALTREPIGGKPQGVDAGPVVAKGAFNRV